MFSLHGSLLVVFLATCRTVNCQSYLNATNLRTALLYTYNQNLLPLNNFSDVMNVNLTLQLYSMPSVDPVRGTVTLAIQVLLDWYDERITWTPADYGGIDEMLITKGEAWAPPIVVAQAIEILLLGESWMQIHYLSDGKAFFDPGDVMEITCPFHMKYWPYDKQVCIISFFTLGYLSNKIQLSPSSEVAKTAFYQKNGEWTLDKDSFQYRSLDVYGYSQIQFKIKLRRNSEFYVLTIILPLNCIAGLACLVFLLPSESGERVSFIITILLSLAVFLSVVSDDIPKSTNPLPIMCGLILFEMLVGIIATIFAILNLRIYHRCEDILIGKWYRKLVTLSRCRRNNVQQEQQQQERNGNNIKFTKRCATCMFSTDTSSKTSKDTKSNPPELPLNRYQNSEITEDITWQEVSKAIDKVLFYALVILLYIPSVMINIVLIASSDYNDPYGSNWE